MIRIAIVGLGQVGKSTLFRILTRAHGAQAASKTETHVGVVPVPDTRLDRLSAMYNPKKTVHASIEYLDAPGSVIDLLRTGTRASASVKEVDALAHVVRAFRNEAVPAPSGEVNPKSDVETTDLELILSDLAVIEKRIERLAKDAKKQKNPTLEKELQVVEKCKETLEKQIPLRQVEFSPEEEKLIRGFTFLSQKPVVYVMNLDEADAARTEAADQFAGEMGLARKPRTAVTAVCGKVEAEMAELSDAEAAEFMESYGLKESAISRFIRTGYRLLDLISFFTVGEDECRAWTIRAASTALEAAGEIHSDIQKGFIRAEVVAYDDLVSDGSLAEARAHGRLKLEGKEYVVHDGEVVHFRHSG
ncbi:MAG TPA: redox-regulated ATPase YchF [Terriglobia bacterium]|nr:redox-regulated ATPase YchF [Terriglobia bacterium]